jgi:hypothetical protein
VDRAALELLSPERAATEGAALGQLACALDGGGLLAPGLFRLDFTPREETLGLYPKTLGPEAEWHANEQTWDGYRDPKGPAPIELMGTFENGLRVWIHVLSFTERDALATHFVAKAEIRPSSTEPSSTA